MNGHITIATINNTTTTTADGAQDRKSPREDRPTHLRDPKPSTQVDSTTAGKGDGGQAAGLGG